MLNLLTMITSTKSEQQPTPAENAGTNSNYKTGSQRRRGYALWGAAAGLLVGLGDFAILHWLNFDFDVTINGKDALWLLLLVVGGTYALLGYVAARLYETKQDIASDKTIIEKQLQALRASQQKNIEYEKLAAIGRLAAGVAHEVRNPLAVIKSATALIVEESQPLSTDSERAGKFVHQEITRLDNFIAQLLDFAKPTDMQFCETAIIDILDHLAELLHLEDTFSNTTIAIEHPDHIPLIECDAGMITQALLALLRNAVEAAGDGKVVLQVTLNSNNSISFFIKDDGPGISPEDQQRLFEPFFTNKAKGTGLGLVMAERIVTSHFGRLNYIASAGLGDNGQGACFELVLPHDINEHLLKT